MPCISSRENTRKFILLKSPHLSTYSIFCTTRHTFPPKILSKISLCLVARIIVLLSSSTCELSLSHILLEVHLYSQETNEQKSVNIFRKYYNKLLCHPTSPGHVSNTESHLPHLDSSHWFLSLPNLTVRSVQTGSVFQNCILNRMFRRQIRFL